MEWSGPPGWGLGAGLTTQPCKKLMLRNQTKSLGIVEIRKTKMETGNQKYPWVHGTFAHYTAHYTGAAHTVTQEIERYKLKTTAI